MTRSPRANAGVKADANAGFTLIELMVTITLLAILLSLAVPAFNSWVRNSKMRSTADALQNGLRTAQTEALRRSRQTVFWLTNSATPQSTGATATGNGANWAISIAKFMTEPVAFGESGVLGDTSSGVVVTGPSAVCFNSIGRLVTNADTGVSGGDCAATAIPAVYDVTLPNFVAGTDRRLRLLVATGGQVRMCDPDKTLSSSTPDGCP